MPFPPTLTAQVLKTPDGEAAYHIVERIIDSGYEAWWVGGCVRDMALSKMPQEIDIATSALPQQIKKLFPQIDPKGEQFGSIVVREQGSAIEVTSFREDDEASDGRHPESVAFTTDKVLDARRRDLTVNALYWNPISRELFDPYDGMADIREKLIRFIGDPALRIRHDALRILRAVRLRAAIEGQYHPDTYRALTELASLVELLSGSRQMEELEKMLLCPLPQRAFEDLWETRILSYMLPQLYACKGIAQPADYHHEGDVWDHTMQCIASAGGDHGIDVRIAILFHDCGKTETFKLKERIRFDNHASISSELATKALTYLQVPSKRIEKISWLIKHHMMMASFQEMNDERKSHWYHHPWFTELTQVFWLDIAGTIPGDFAFYETIMSDYHHFLDTHPCKPKPLLTGDDVMDILGIQPGERVGEILKTLFDAQIRKEITTKADAKEWVQAQAGTIRLTKSTI